MQADEKLENALQRVNAKISLPENEVRRNNEILVKVIDLFITEMKKDSLFEVLYERVFYGGSFYDGLRIEKPNEFDIDILLRIPKLMSLTIDTTNVPGFVNCRILDKSSVTNQKFLNMFNGEGYLGAKSVRAWMEGLTSKAINALCPGRKLKVLSYTFTVTTRKSGPAMTLYLEGNEVSLDIDIIPCFVFRKNEWPKDGYRPNPIPEKSEFFIVPKTPKRKKIIERAKNVEFLWRFSFQEQERVMIEDKQFLKPALKLLKRLRDREDHLVIASYYIKTIFLWEVAANNKIFNSSLAESFLVMLDKYIEWLEDGEIPYFWNKNNNLLIGVHPSTLQNYANRLKKIRNMKSDAITAYMS